MRRPHCGSASWPGRLALPAQDGYARRPECRRHLHADAPRAPESPSVRSGRAKGVGHPLQPLLEYLQSLRHRIGVQLILHLPQVAGRTDVGIPDISLAHFLGNASLNSGV